MNAPPSNRIGLLLRRWWFVPIFLIALGELIFHAWQTRTVLDPQDWLAARASLEAKVQAEDLVLLAPSWVEPVGRMHLGDGLMTPGRVARADESRFPRAFEVALGRASSPATRSWPVEAEERIGPLRIRQRKNPAFQPVVDDLVDHARGAKMEVGVVRAGRHQPCTWRDGTAITGPLGFGPAVPGSRFHCPRNAWVGETINADLDYAPRRCIYAPPPGGQETMQLRFKQVRFGARIEGHHALYVEAERDRKGTPVRIAFSHDGKDLGEATHEDGQGWVGFALDTPELAGRTGELLVSISSPRGDRRMYCFEATTR